MTVYIINEYVRDWGITSKVFSTMEKAQGYMKQYIGTEILARKSKEEIMDFLNEMEVDWYNDKPDLISIIWLDAEGNDYLEVVEVEVDA